jgi:type IV pilus assembly protein PilC
MRRGRRAGKRGTPVSIAAPEEGAAVSFSRRITAGALRMGVSRVPQRDITAFLRQLIMLVEAGTPILKSLRTLSERGPRAGIRALVADIAQYVEAGNPLWQAFERHPRYFTPDFVNLIKASEASGTLVSVLERVANYRERRQLLAKRVQSAMLYPIVLMFVCAGVVVVLTKFVVPSFMDMYSKMNMKLPAFTTRFLGVVDFIGTWWWLLIAGLIVLIVLYKLLVRNPLWRLRADRIKLSIPLIGPILNKYAIVEFTRTLSLLLKSGLSMMVTLDLVRNAIKNRAVAHMLQSVRDSVERGAGLEQPLRQASRIIPPVVTDMLVTGEESGQLDKIAEQVADIYEEEMNISVGALGDMLVPIVTILIGILVAIVALALFVPMISMMDQVQGGA